MILHEDGTIELESGIDTDVEESFIPDGYYEAPLGCCDPLTCKVQGEHRLDECRE